MDAGLELKDRAARAQHQPRSPSIQLRPRIGGMDLDEAVKSVFNQVKAAVASRDHQKGELAEVRQESGDAS